MIIATVVKWCSACCESALKKGSSRGTEGCSILELCGTPGCVSGKAQKGRRETQPKTLWLMSHRITEPWNDLGWRAALPTAGVGVGGLGGLFQPKPFYEFCGFYEKKMLVFIDLQWINSAASAVLTPVLPREHTVVALQLHHCPHLHSVPPQEQPCPPVTCKTGNGT